MDKNTEKIINDHSIKVELSDKTNLIEQSSYHYSLQERETPNLYRHLYDYETVPKVTFNHRFVPMNMPKDIFRSTAYLLPKHWAKSRDCFPKMAYTPPNTEERS